MLKTRRRTNPRIPEDLMEYGKLIEEFGDKYGKVDGNKFYYGKYGEGDCESVIFVVPTLAHLLSSTDEIHMDGTFKTIPKKPHSRQLFTIMAVEDDNVSQHIIL